jgi:hypothetical protein
MDLSKLPKLSQTAEAARKEGASPPAAAAAPVPAVGATPSYQGQAGPVLGGEVWISLVLGLVFVFLGWTFVKYVATVAQGHAFHTQVNWTEGPKAGQEVAYFELQGYTAWTDASMFLFGAALIADAALLLVAAGALRRWGWLVWVGFAVTLMAVAMNAVTALMLVGVGITPLLSLVAIAIGGYMAAYQWRLVAGTRGSAA